MVFVRSKSHVLHGCAKVMFGSSSKSESCPEFSTGLLIIVLSICRIERSYGKFERRFRLPENASSSEIQASAKDGVLTVTIPKQKPKENKTVDVQVQ
jgi:hypothetical protein